MNTQTQQQQQPQNGSPASSELVLQRNSALEYRRTLDPGDLDTAFKVATAIATTGYCGVKTAEEALVRIMYGRELGLSAVQSLRAVYVVEGRPGLDASVMHALCLQSPQCEYFEVVETTATKATYRAKRAGRPEFTLTWTIDQAKQAGAFGGRPKKDNPNEQTKPKDNWVSYPENMLRARCISNLARLMFPEAVNGMYTPDELEMGEGATTPQVVDVDVKEVKQVIDKHEQLAKDLVEAIGAVKSKEQKAKVRERIDALIESGDLAGPYKEKVTGAYNARFKAPKGGAAQTEPSPAAATAPTQPAPKSDPQASDADRSDADEGP